MRAGKKTQYVTEETFDRLWKSYNTLSLDVPLKAFDGDETKATMIDTIESNDPPHDDEVNKRLEIERVIKLCNSVLDERERRILFLHYVEGVTLEEIGKRLHRSRERIRQITVIAKNKVRDALRKQESDVLYPNEKIPAKEEPRKWLKKS